jgi:ribosomal-protein-alanine N-acetyltransferase
MKLRVVIAADGPALAEIHAASFEAPWSAAEILRFAEDLGGFGFVAATPGGEICGFILCRAIAGEAEVLTLAVRPDHRRRGVASALIGEAVARAAPASGAMFLEVAADNEGAAALYEGLGFSRIGRRAGYYARGAGPAVDAIVMRRTLNT